jgi:hypothetical protein
MTLHNFCNLSASARGQRCINTRPLEFAQFVGDSVDNGELRRQMPMTFICHDKHRWLLQFAILCEMPTDDIHL